MSRRTIGAPNDDRPPRRCLPSLFSAAEWKAIVAHLGLTPRQAEIVDLILRGQRDKEITARLGMKQPTLTTHVRKILRRLNAMHRMEIAYRVFIVFRKLFEQQHL